MAQAGLSNLNPLVSSAGSDLNPLVNRTPPAMSGLDALQQSLAGITAMGEAARAQVRTPEIAAPPAQQAPTPTIAFSPSRGEFFVQGRTFSKDDAQSAIESEALLGQPGAPLPTGDWVPVDPQAYAGYLQGIKEPSLGTLFSKGIGRGIDTSQLLIGRGLQLAGAEEFGGGIVTQQMEDLRRGMPFSRQFTDIQDPGDALEWFVAGFGEQVPNLLESVAVAGAGAIGGTFTGGPGVGSPGVGRPGVGGPGVGNPGVGRPDAGRPGSAAPGAGLRPESRPSAGQRPANVQRPTQLPSRGNAFAGARDGARAGQYANRGAQSRQTHAARPAGGGGGRAAPARGGGGGGGGRHR